MNVWHEHVCEAETPDLPLTIHYQATSDKQAELYEVIRELGDVYLVPLCTEMPLATHVTIGIFNQPIDQEDDIIRRLAEVEKLFQHVHPRPTAYQYDVLDKDVTLDQPYYSRSIWLAIWTEAPADQTEKALEFYATQGMVWQIDFIRQRDDHWWMSCGESHPAASVHLHS